MLYWFHIHHMQECTHILNDIFLSLSLLTSLPIFLYYLLTCNTKERIYKKCSINLTLTKWKPSLLSSHPYSSPPPYSAPSTHLQVVHHQFTQAVRCAVLMRTQWWNADLRIDMIGDYAWLWWLLGYEYAERFGTCANRSDWFGYFFIFYFFR